MRFDVSLAAAVPRLPKVPTARPRPVLPCAPASPNAALVAEAAPPTDLAAEIVDAAPIAPAPTMPAAPIAAVPAAAPAVIIGLPDNIDAAIAGICTAMTAKIIEPPNTVKIRLKTGAPGCPIVCNIFFHCIAWVLPMPTIRKSINSFTPVATA